jgi:hypothetical protein
MKLNKIEKQVIICFERHKNEKSQELRSTLSILQLWQQWSTVTDQTESSRGSPTLPRMTFRHRHLHSDSFAHDIFARNTLVHDTSSERRSSPETFPRVILRRRN